jgi:DNA-binding transcriptional LysR family regulator
VQALREGTIDIGVVMDNVARDGLASYEYRHDRLVAVVPRKHPLRVRQIEFEKLIKYDLVGLDSFAAMMQLLAQSALAIE